VPGEERSARKHRAVGVDSMVFGQVPFIDIVPGPGTRKSPSAIGEPPAKIEQGANHRELRARVGFDYAPVLAVWARCAHDVIGRLE
jgi:hypothetical protein